MESDAAAVAYIHLCLKGRALRLKKKWSLTYSREQLVFDTIPYEAIMLKRLMDSTPIDEKIMDKIIIEQAMECLTSKEKRILIELYWNDKQVISLCKELYVSKNTILKTKRHALEKMRQRITQ